MHWEGEELGDVLGAVPVLENRGRSWCADGAYLCPPNTPIKGHYLSSRPASRGTVSSCVSLPCRREDKNAMLITPYKTFTRLGMKVQGSIWSWASLKGKIGTDGAVLSESLVWTR